MEPWTSITYVRRLNPNPVRQDEAPLGDERDIDLLAHPYNRGRSMGRLKPAPTTHTYVRAGFSRPVLRLLRAPLHTSFLKHLYIRTESDTLPSERRPRVQVPG
jgi:hypothetical protein